MGKPSKQGIHIRGLTHQTSHFFTLKFTQFSSSETSVIIFIYALSELCKYIMRFLNYMKILCDGTDENGYLRVKIGTDGTITTLIYMLYVTMLKIVGSCTDYGCICFSVARGFYRRSRG